MEWKQQVCPQRQHVSVKLQGAEREVTIYFLNFLCRYENTVFARVICALFFILAAKKSGCVKYVDFFVEVLILVLF